MAHIAIFCLGVDFLHLDMTYDRVNVFSGDKRNRSRIREIEKWELQSTVHITSRFISLLLMRFRSLNYYFASLSGAYLKKRFRLGQEVSSGWWYEFHTETVARPAVSCFSFSPHVPVPRTWHSIRYMLRHLFVNGKQHTSEWHDLRNRPTYEINL